jgi:hypothetical protein
LRQILVDHEFVYEQGKTGKNQPGAISNPLFPNAESIKKEYWKTGLNNQTPSSENGSNIIRSVSLIEWKSGNGPHPDAIKTISIWINEDPIYAKKVETFLQRIKDCYPIKAQRYPGNSKLQREYSEPINVLANNVSKSEVRISRGQVDEATHYYIVSFDLVR